MTDIVERLRAALRDALDPCRHDVVTLVEDAAGEIERLRMRNRKLKTTISGWTRLASSHGWVASDIPANEFE